MQTFTDCRSAIRAATIKGAHCVGWVQEKSAWIIYNPAAPVPDGCKPELFCAGLGALPVPLSAEGEEVLASALRAQIEGK